MKLFSTAKDRERWHYERLSVARAPDVVNFTPPLTISMQAGMVPCSRCGDKDHPSTSKYCPLATDGTVAPARRPLKQPSRNRRQPGVSPRHHRTGKQQGAPSRPTTDVSTFLTALPVSPTSNPGSSHAVSPVQASGVITPAGMVLVHKRARVRAARGLNASVDNHVPSISGIVSRHRRVGVVKSGKRKAALSVKVPIFRGECGSQLLCMNAHPLNAVLSFQLPSGACQTTSKFGQTTTRRACPSGLAWPLCVCTTPTQESTKHHRQGARHRRGQHWHDGL